MITSTILAIFIIGFIKTIEVKTGKNSLYFKEQFVSVGYINIGEEANVYYQYFISSKKKVQEKKVLTFYIGHKIAESAQKYGYLGYIPYNIVKNTTDPLGLTMVHNSRSLNSITDLVVVDITRGSGFTTNSSPRKVDYDLIAQDLEFFIKAFFSYENIASDTKVVIYAGYELAKVAYTFGQKSEKSVNLIIENPWLGYSSISQLYYQLPAYGDTSRRNLDMISNHIYSLQVSDYGKDLDDMYTSLSEMMDYLEGSAPFNTENPVMDQSLVSLFKSGIQDFFTNCKTCRAYCSLEKDQWQKNSTLRSMVKRDLLFDVSSNFLTELNKVNGYTMVLQSRYTLLSSLQPVIESTTDYVSLGRVLEESLEEAGNLKLGDKWQIRFLDNAGFYPYIDDADTILNILEQFYYED